MPAMNAFIMQQQLMQMQMQQQQQQQNMRLNMQMNDDRRQSPFTDGHNMNDMQNRFGK